MTLEEKYDWVLNLAVKTGVHPHYVLCEAVVTEIISRNEELRIKELLIERRSEHRFNVEPH